MTLDSNYEYNNNLLLFWKEQHNHLPLLARTARSIFAVQASSSESERYFSMSGRIVIEQRSILDSDCVEALVELKEAYLNNLWPKEE
ncbi:unnamed protein product [Rotaria sordida]|uniref:HAT C-terminal dimerisation domain-containing protein n=1 Tax=Rotaria sordida TaxID=392033 RepID=A0A814F1N8_9BILA|nr:unnamed protein product [Rotaria sordida]